MLKKKHFQFGECENARIFAPAKRIISLFCTKDSVAQLVEHNTFNVGVLGSSPSGITETPSLFKRRCFCIIPGREVYPDIFCRGAPAGSLKNKSLRFAKAFIFPLPPSAPLGVTGAYYFFIRLMFVTLITGLLHEA